MPDGVTTTDEDEMLGDMRMRYSISNLEDRSLRKNIVIP